MEITFYPVTIEKHKEGGYYAKCPFIQGAWAEGETIKQAVSNLKSIVKDILEYRKTVRQKPFKFTRQVFQQGLALAV